MVRSFEEARKRYGDIVGNTWPDEAQWCITVQVPAEISAHLYNSATGKPATHIYCNRDMALPLKAVLSDLVAEGLESALLTFDGCLSIRDVRGVPGRPSAHAYACAVDFDAGRNPLGSTPLMDPKVVEVFKRHGFAWGGDFQRLDGMHYSYCWE